MGDSGRLLLLYQPIHDARTGEIRAAEALLRQVRQSGEVREAEIIQAAAEASVGPELFMLDSLLVRRAYTDAARWQDGRPDVRLNVNLSPREFQEGDVLNRLTSLITSCGVDPSRVTLEITETTYIESPEDTMKLLEELKELGIGLWLDDFGSKHSALTHLRHFPVDGLKIGGEFIRGVPDNSRCVAIVRFLIDLAHDLDLEVTAEEIESRAQLEFLLEQNCDYIQGFLFSRPMRIEKLEQLLVN